MDAVIKVKNINKKYGRLRVLRDVSLNIARGQVVGLIGLNGAGKTTLLNTMLGFTSCQGEVEILNMHPRYHRKQLMSRVGFIADVAILPGWMKIFQIMDFVAGVHPAFDREQALKFLNQTDLNLDKKIKALSKGMLVQLHLALILAVNADILVLDEPTLGLDILHRKEFYRHLLHHYLTEERTILISSHQVEEIEHLLTHILMINKGTLILNCSRDEFAHRFIEVTAPLEKYQTLQALQPLLIQKQLQEIKCVFENVEATKISALGKLSTPSISDVFVAKVGGRKS